MSDQWLMGGPPHPLALPGRGGDRDLGIAWGGNLDLPLNVVACHDELSKEIIHGPKI